MQLCAGRMPRMLTADSSSMGGVPRVGTLQQMGLTPFLSRVFFSQHVVARFLLSLGIFDSLSRSRHISRLHNTLPHSLLESVL